DDHPNSLKCSVRDIARAAPFATLSGESVKGINGINGTRSHSPETAAPAARCPTKTDTRSEDPQGGRPHVEVQDIPVEAEADRREAEQVRRVAEKTREAREQERKTAEELRDGREQLREAAETAR